METADQFTLEQALADVSDALDRAAAVPTLTASDSDHLAALEALPVLRNKLDSLAAELSRGAEVGAAVGRAGCRNAAIWVGKHTAAAPKHTRADVRVARWLLAFGGFAEAHQAGVLSRDHIRLLQHADKPITHHALLRDQAVLIESARTCSFAGFETAVQYWINLADPDGDIPTEQIRNNEVSVTRRADGSISFKGQLDPLLGTALDNAINAEFEKVATADADNNVCPGRRSQRAQALANLVSKGATRADGTIAAPLINIVMSEQVAEDLVEGLVPHVDPDDLDGRCEFLDGTPLHPAFAAKLMPRAMFRRIIFDADSRPIDVSVNVVRFAHLPSFGRPKHRPGKSTDAMFRRSRNSVSAAARQRCKRRRSQTPPLEGWANRTPQCPSALRSGQSSQTRPDPTRYTRRLNPTKGPTACPNQTTTRRPTRGLTTI